METNKRLTRKTNIGYFEEPIGDGEIYTHNQKLTNIDNIIQKLGQLEDIEEDLGIDLLTLIKALTQSIYFIDKDNEIKTCFIEHLVLSMKDEELHTRGKSSVMHDKNMALFVSSPYKYGERHFGLKDYGKTWALTREELL